MSIKKGFEEAISNMLALGSDYFRDYAYFGFIIAQCNLVFDSKLPAPAAVRFMNTQYDLIINPKQYNSMPLAWRIGTLKHECGHILGNHIMRAELGNYDNLGFNYAGDCAINQDINLDHLPSITKEDLRNKPNPKKLKVGDPNCIIPANFPSKTSPVPKGLSAEHYYDLLDKSKLPPEQPKSDEGESQSGDSQSQPDEGSSTPLGGLVDDPSIWEESEGIEEIKDTVTKSMIEKAFDQTAKVQGNIPSSHSEWLKLFSTKSQVSWKKLLRNITGSKRANSKPTLLRKNRRTPELRHIKGHTKQRVFDLLVVSDVSGSVSSEELTGAWSEVLHICKLTNTPVSLIQVDTHASTPEPLKATSKTLNRKACGGTILAPAIAKAKEHHTAYNCVVVTTDGYIDQSDVDAYRALKVPVIWLITSNGRVMDSMNSGNMTAVKLKGESNAN